MLECGGILFVLGSILMVLILRSSILSYILLLEDFKFNELLIEVFSPISIFLLI